MSPGWDANLHAEWYSAWTANNDIDGNSTTAASPAWIKKHELNLFQNTGFQVGDEIILRFRMLADLVVSGWGWMIDNLKIQGGTQNISNLEIANTLPTILTDKVYISNSSPIGTNLLFEAKDLDKDNLTYEIISGNNGTLGFSDRGELKLLGNPNANSDLNSILVKVSDGTGNVTKTLGVLYCESDNTLTKNVNNVTKSYRSNSTLSSTQQIMGSSKIIYNATHNITLQPGFIADKGVTFSIQAGIGCP